MIKQPPAYWSVTQSDLLTGLCTRPEGLSSPEAKQRLMDYGANLLKPPKRSDTLSLLLAQFKSPIILTLVFAAGLSFFLQDPIDAVIILFIVLISGLLGFWQERGAVVHRKKYGTFHREAAATGTWSCQADIMAPIPDVRSTAGCQPHSRLALPTSSTTQSVSHFP